MEYKNAALFWGLIAVILLVVLVILIMLCCYCCPCCPYYKKDKSVSTPKENIRTYVRNGEGEDLRDARYVGVLKSAGERIKSASKEGKSKARFTKA